MEGTSFRSMARIPRRRQPAKPTGPRKKRPKSASLRGTSSDRIDADISEFFSRRLAQNQSDERTRRQNALLVETQQDRERVRLEEPLWLRAARVAYAQLGTALDLIAYAETPDAVRKHLDAKVQGFLRGWTGDRKPVEKARVRVFRRVLDEMAEVHPGSSEIAQIAATFNESELRERTHLPEDIAAYLRATNMILLWSVLDERVRDQWTAWDKPRRHKAILSAIQVLAAWPRTEAGSKAGGAKSKWLDAATLYQSLTREDGELETIAERIRKIQRNRETQKPE